MTASWMSADVGGVKPVKAGRSLFPAGVNTYTVASAAIEKGRQGNQLVLSLQSPNGGGQHTIALQPWKEDEKSIKMFLGILRAWFEGLGLPFEGPAGTLLHNLPSYVPQIPGTVIEVDVKQGPGKPMIDQGTGQPILDDNGMQRRHMDQRVYMGRLVSRPPQAAPPVGQQTQAFIIPPNPAAPVIPDTTAFVPVGAADDLDGIPFSPQGH